MNKATFFLFFLSILIIVRCMLIQEEPLTVTGYWQGSIEIEGSFECLQLHLYQSDTVVTGWVKTISGYSFSTLPITEGTFNPEEKALTIQAAGSEGTYLFSGTVSRYSMGGEGTYIHGNQEEGFSWAVQRGESFASLSGSWEGRLLGEGIDAELQLDFTQSDSQLRGWIKVATGDAMVMLTITSGSVDTQRMLVNFTAQGTPSPIGGEESYTFTGTLLLINRTWREMKGSCHYSSHGQEIDLNWWATRIAKGHEIE